jgi:hypothetical protein
VTGTTGRQLKAIDLETLDGLIRFVDRNLNGCKVTLDANGQLVIKTGLALSIDGSKKLVYHWLNSDRLK